jgi:peptidoglycan/LPS O-acetylase OafA/YrhL
MTMLFACYSEQVKKGRSDVLDVVRGVAALLVVVMHATGVVQRYVYNEDFLLYNIAFYVDFGRIGVVAFFLISGFLIPSSLGKEGGQNFWIKRFFRLYPAYWVSVIFSFCGCWLYMKRNVGLDVFAANLLMFQEYLGYESAAGLYWTLHVELVFYMSVYFLYILTLSLRGNLIGVVIFVTISVFIAIMGAEAAGLLQKSDSSHRVAMTCFHLGIMYFGALLRNVTEVGQFPKLLSISGVVLYCVLGSFVLMFLGAIIATLSGINPRHSDVVRLCFSYPIGLFVFCFFMSFRFRCLRLLAYIGRISYSLYLFHPGLIYPMAVMFSGSVIHRYLSHDAGGVLIIIIMLLCSIIVASVMHKFVEVPGISFAKKLVVH